MKTPQNIPANPARVIDFTRGGLRERVQKLADQIVDLDLMLDSESLTPAERTVLEQSHTRLSTLILEQGGELCIGR